jgi:hypothetical protein
MNAEREAVDMALQFRPWVRTIALVHSTRPNPADIYGELMQGVIPVMILSTLPVLSTEYVQYLLLFSRSRRKQGQRLIVAAYNGGIKRYRHR